MKIEHGIGKTSEGPGVNIELTGDEVATAISAWLVANGVEITGPRTIRVNSQLCRYGSVYVDPVGHVNYKDETFHGRGLKITPYAGHCVEGESRCVCGGDTPRVRSGCGNWRTA